MRHQLARWLVAALVALMVSLGFAFSSGQSQIVYGANPTPTPTFGPTGVDPGGHGGGGGGG